MSLSCTVKTHETWLRFRREHEVDLHCDSHCLLTATASAPGTEDAAQWTAERMLLASLELATCSRFNALAARERLRVLAYESNAHGRVRHDDAGAHWLDIIIRPWVVVSTPAEAATVERIFEEIRRSEAYGVSLRPAPEIVPCVEVPPHERRRRRTESARPELGR